MEILNNVWDAISVSNPQLINVLFIFLNIFVEAPLSISIINNVLSLNATKRQKIIYIFVASLAAILGMFLIPDPFNVIVNYLSVFFTILIIFKMKFIKTIIATILPSMIYPLVGNLILNPYLTLLGINYEQVNTVPMYRIPFALAMYSIVFLINFVIKHRKIKLTILDDFGKKNKAMIIANFLFGLFNIVVQIVITVNYIDLLPIDFTFLNFISLSAYFSVSLFSLNKVMTLVTTTEKLVDTTEKLESAEAYNETLHILHDNVRGFKHDFNNIVSTIGGFINTNDMEGLKNYYSQLEEDNQKVNNLYLLNPDLINNPGVYNLITVKYKKAVELGIKMNLTFLLDLKQLHMKVYEFARILGILLDNAIEAAGESEEKIINIVFRKDYRNQRNIIQIENSYQDKDVDIEKIFGKGISGKEDHSGIGLWEVREILKRNNHTNLFTFKSPEYFSQQLEIYYVEEEPPIQETPLNSNPSEEKENVLEEKTTEVQEIPSLEEKDSVTNIETEEKQEESTPEKQLESIDS